MRHAILDLFREAKASSKFVGGDAANVTGSIVVNFSAKIILKKVMV
jgi:hypothetical protein